nr:ataxin-8-like [Dermacentor andersoni]
MAAETVIRRSRKRVHLEQQGTALSSFLSLGGAAEAIGANPPMRAHRFQFLDAHRQRLQRECQPQELLIQQEQQQVGRPLQRQQHHLQRQRQQQQQLQRELQQQQQQQRQQQLLLEHQRSIFRYPAPPPS